MGITIGLIFGFAISGGAGFPGSSTFAKRLADPSDPHSLNLNARWVDGNYEWGYESYRWFGMISDLFINGLMIMIIPILFLAMARIMTKKSQKGLGRITGMGIAILLINVAVAFVITFWLGQAMRIGKGFHLHPHSTDRAPMRSLTDIITKYMPSNFFKNMSTMVVIPVLVLGTLIGYAIRKSSKRYPEQMETARKNIDRYWKLSVSVLITIIKFMPYAVLTMIAKAIFARPIAEFASIGEIIGLGYLGLLIAYGWHVLTVWLFGVSPTKFMKRSAKPVLSGFLTQSSLATMPMAVETLKDEFKLDQAASPSIVMPLSTTMGLTGCAGVQSGVILTILFNASDSPVTMGIGVFFILGLIVTVITSLGIAGVPGTAGIVTVGVISTMGFPLMVSPIVGIISPLNGIFDMGRTAVNVNGGMQATTITSSLAGELPDEMKSHTPFRPFINWTQKYVFKNNEVAQPINKKTKK